MLLGAFIFMFSFTFFFGKKFVSSISSQGFKTFSGVPSIIQIISGRFFRSILALSLFPPTISCFALFHSAKWQALYYLFFVSEKPVLASYTQTVHAQHSCLPDQKKSLTQTWDNLSASIRCMLWGQLRVLLHVRFLGSIFQSCSTTLVKKLKH